MPIHVRLIQTAGLCSTKSSWDPNHWAGAMVHSNDLAGEHSSSSTKLNVSPLNDDGVAELATHTDRYYDRDSLANSDSKINLSGCPSNENSSAVDSDVHQDTRTAEKHSNKFRIRSLLARSDKRSSDSSVVALPDKGWY